MKYQIFTLLLHLAIPFWHSSALLAQVVSVTDFASSGRSLLRSDIMAYRGELYFGVGVEGTSQRELWRFDGNQAELVADHLVGDTITSIDNMIEYQGDLYFTADNGDSGLELFRFDGKAVTLAADIEPGPEGSSPTSLMVHNGDLFFSAKQGDSFNNLWKFDGSAATLVKAFDFPSASVSTGATLGGNLFFGANDGLSGTELWRYDGIDLVRVVDLNVGEASSFPRNFVTSQDSVFFVAETPELGRELWRTDGVTTELVRDINPGPAWSNPLNVSVVDTETGETLIFSATEANRAYVWHLRGETLDRVANGGAPIEVGGDLLMLRGKRGDGGEVQELWFLDEQDESRYRTLTESPGPFAVLDEQLYFGCGCESRELMRAAVAGDADLDGAITFVDFLLVATHFGKSGTWTEGDFDHSGVVTFADFLPLAMSFSGEGQSPTASVPEPAFGPCASLLVLLLPGGVRRRREVVVPSCRNDAGKN